MYFKNDIDNYIYLLDTATKKEEVLIANHSQRDAEFEGYELSIGSSFDLYQGLDINQKKNRYLIRILQILHPVENGLQLTPLLF